jgi:hypothetical protein
MTHIQAAIQRNWVNWVAFQSPIKCSPTSMPMACITYRSHPYRGASITIAAIPRASSSTAIEYGACLKRTFSAPLDRRLRISRIPRPMVMMTADRSSPFRIAPENTMLPPAAQSPPKNIPMRLKIGSLLSCILSIITPFFATATCRHYACLLNNARVGSPFFGIFAYYRHASAVSSLIIGPASRLALTGRCTYVSGLRPVRWAECERRGGECFAWGRPSLRTMRSSRS